MSLHVWGGVKCAKHKNVSNESFCFSFFFQAAEGEGSLQSDEMKSSPPGSDAVRSARRIDEVAWETVQAVKGDCLPLGARRHRLPSHRRGIRLSRMRWP